jgi:hypothetical protein
MFQGTVYTTTREGKAFAVTASNGNVLFGHALDGASLIFGSVPSAAGIYTVSGPTLYLLNSFSLQIKWSMAFDSEITALPAYSPLQDILFLITQSGTLYAYQPGTRKLVWKQSLGLKSKAISSPLVVGDTVLVSTAAGHVYGFAARGDGYGNPALLWRYMAPAIPSYEFKHPWIDPDLAAQPVVYGQNLLLLAADGTLNCMSTTTIDEDGPTAEYRFPMYGPYPDNPIYAITARITDPGSGIRTLPNPGVGPAKGDVKMFLDGQSVLRLGGDFSYDVYAGKLKYKPATPYNEGTHLVEVQAVDNRGNFKSIKWTFDISKTAPPLEAPTTTGTTPGTPGQPGAGPGNP